MIVLILEAVMAPENASAQGLAKKRLHCITAKLRVGVLLSSVALLLASVSSSPAQVLYGGTELSGPGLVVSVTGDGFSDATEMSVRHIRTDDTWSAPYKLTPSRRTPMSLTANLPNNIPNGLYRVEVNTPGQPVGVRWVNLPRVQWIDKRDGMPGQIIRLIGRNLRPTSALPSVTLRGSDNTTYPVEVTTANSYAVSFKIPNVSPGSYQIRVNSLLSGASSEVSAPETLNVVALGADPFGIGTAWASEFASIAANQINVKTDKRLAVRALGDGVTDDTPAVLAAVKLAQQLGGGTVYFPAGRYRIDNGNTVQIKSRVVFAGSDPGNTILEVGYRFGPNDTPPSYGWALQMQEGEYNGMMCLTVRNLSQSSKPNNVFRGASPVSQARRFFIKYCAFEMGNATVPQMNKIREGVIFGSKFVSTATETMGPMLFNGAQDLRISQCTFQHRAGRVFLNYALRCVFENSTIQLDKAYYAPIPVESGAIELSMSQQIFLNNNLIEGVNGLPSDHIVGGEMILAQRSSIADFWDAGTVASATETGLVAQNRSWPLTSWLSPNHEPLPRTFVAITRGKGAGQLRRVVQNGSNSVTIDRPWDVIPDSTSIYAIGSLVAHQQTWTNNRVRNSFASIMLWNGGTDCTIANNTITNGGPLVVRSSSQTAPTSAGTLSQCILWNCLVRDNINNSPDGYTAACVSLSAVITRPVGSQSFMGVLLLDANMSNNRVGGSFYAGATAGLAQYDGIESYMVHETSLNYDPLSRIGTSIYGNSVTGSNYPFRITP